jgi:hypothetical protein
MRKILLLALFIFCNAYFFCSCRYFTQSSNHDQSNAEKLVQKYMINLYHNSYRYNSISFGALDSVKDSVVNFNGKSEILKGAGWKKIENTYLIKDSRGNTVNQKTDWFLIDSSMTKAGCCILKK